MKRIFLCMMTAMGCSAQTFTKLYDFSGTESGAPWANPSAPLVQGTDGNLYLTTPGGAHGAGAVLKIASGGVSTLYSFCSQSECSDGEKVYAGLVRGANGDLYGTTQYGGAYGHGTVFALTLSGILTTLYSFCAGGYPCADGEYPFTGLVQAASGELYGTTQYGGSSPVQNGDGTIFEITPSGAFATLYSFCAGGYPCTSGEPVVGLVQAVSGEFYGIAGGPYAGGPIFKITPAGAFTMLSKVGGGLAPLIQAGDGNFYGTTPNGGGSANAGTIFKMTPSGTLTTLYSFCGQTGCPDGQQPFGGLVQATDGNFYGTTESGGANDGGTIFRFTPGGALTTLHSFSGPEGAAPSTALLQSTNGTLDGTTSTGGFRGFGTLFSLSVGLAPFVETQPATGRAGAAVEILGTDLTSATSVTFNGVAAVFKVVSPSLITTTVPAGAATGTVQVVTSAGALSSNVSFRVRP